MDRIVMSFAIQHFVENFDPFFVCQSFCLCWYNKPITSCTVPLFSKPHPTQPRSIDQFIDNPIRTRPKTKTTRVKLIVPCVHPIDPKPSHKSSYQILCPAKIKGVTDPQKIAGHILESTPLEEDLYRLGNTKACTSFTFPFRTPFVES